MGIGRDYYLQYLDRSEQYIFLHPSSRLLGLLDPRPMSSEETDLGAQRYPKHSY